MSEIEKIQRVLYKQFTWLAICTGILIVFATISPWQVYPVGVRWHDSPNGAWRELLGDFHLSWYFNSRLFWPLTYLFGFLGVTLAVTLRKFRNIPEWYAFTIASCSLGCLLLSARDIYWHAYRVYYQLEFLSNFPESFVTLLIGLLTLVFYLLPAIAITVLTIVSFVWTVKLRRQKQLLDFERLLDDGAIRMVDE